VDPKAREDFENDPTRNKYCRKAVGREKNGAAEKDDGHLRKTLRESERMVGCAQEKDDLDIPVGGVLRQVKEQENDVACENERGRGTRRLPARKSSQRSKNSEEGDLASRGAVIKRVGYVTVAVTNRGSSNGAEFLPKEKTRNASEGRRTVLHKREKRAEQKTTPNPG